MVLGDAHWEYEPFLVVGADDVDLDGPNHRGCDHGREDGVQKVRPRIRHGHDVRMDRAHG